MALNEGKITQAGLRLMAKVTAGAKLELTKFAVGDGDLGTRDPLVLTDLVRRLYNYSIARISSNNNATTVTFNFSNQVVGTGFYWKEVGLWARDPDVGEILFMYANSGSAAAEYIPAGGSSTILERQFNWRLLGSNASAITATIDQSLMYASQDDLAALAKQSLQVRSVDAAYTTLAQMQQPGVYHISQVSGYPDRPVYESGLSASGPAMLLVKRNPALTMDYDFMQMIEVAADTILHVFIRRIVVASGTTTTGGWVRVMNAGGGTFTETVTMNKTLTVKSTLSAGRGVFSDVIEISSTVPLIFKHPTSTTTRRWVTHLESSGAGGYLHMSPEKADASGWDFDKGLRIDGGTGDIYVKNGLTGPNDRTWINPQRSNGTTPAYTLTIGDSDTGINWVSDGKLQLMANGKEAGYISDAGLIVRHATTGTYWNVANDIVDLKQSGVNRKNELVSAINANGGSALASEDMSILIAKLAAIAGTRYKEGIVTRGSSNPDNDYLTIPSGFNAKFLAEYTAFGFAPSPAIGNWAVGSNSSVTLYVLDADGRQFDLVSGNVNGRSYSLYGIGVETGYVWVLWRDNSASNLTTWTRITTSGIRFNGGLRFRIRITGTVTYSTPTSGNFTGFGG